MKLPVVLVALAALTLSGPTVAVAKVSVPGVTTVDVDQDFLAEVAEREAWLYSACKLTLHKNIDRGVQDFAKQAIADLTKADPELQALAKKHKAKVMPLSYKVTLAELDKLQGHEFENTFVERAKSDRDKLMAYFGHQTARTKDQELSAWMLKTMPMLRRHYGALARLQSNLRNHVSN